MDYKKYINYSTEDFVLDTDFMHWVLSPDQDNDRFWDTFLKNYPEKKDQIVKASYLIKAVKAVEPSISQHRLNKVYDDVLEKSKPIQKSIRLLTRYAAIFILVFSLGGIFYFLQNDQKQLPVVIVDNDLMGKGKIILPDGSVNVFDNKVSEIHQTPTGDLTLNNDTIALNNTSVNKANPELAHVIIPYGKRSEISLSDGTKIWLNSGSQLSYPVSFNGNTREVYLTGEAFFDVQSDAARPFHVITGDMNIKVTGTRFNVTSYKNDQTTQAVLVKGKITASKNKRFSRDVDLESGDRIVYNKQAGAFEKDRVNVELYASWIDGYLIFENEPVGNIFTKLERYYNQRIKIEKLNGLPKFSGKLDLANDLEKVLENISFSASFSIRTENEVFIIKP